MPPIDPVLLRDRTREIAEKFSDPAQCARYVHLLLEDYSDRTHRSSPHLADSAPRNVLKTPAPVVRAIILTLKPLMPAPHSLFFLQRVWDGGTREERRVVAELLGVVSATRTEEIQALVDNWIPTLESGETADALADFGYAPVVLAEAAEHLVRAKKWMLSPNKWARYFSLTSMRPLAKTKTWDDIPTALEILRYAMIDPDAMVRQAAAHLLTDLLVKSPMEIKLFLQEQSARTHPHAHAIVRTVIRALPVEEQTEIIKAMRV